MSRKFPSLCVRKHVLLTSGFAYMSHRKKKEGEYIVLTLLCLSHNLHHLVIY